MLRIRKIQDASTAANRAAVQEAQAILRAQFPGMPAEDIDKLPEQLRNPLKYRFVTTLFVAEDGRDRVRGVAVLLHAPDLGFCYLETVSAAPGRTGRGMGAALYERVREEALALGGHGLFFECLPDDPALSPDPEVRAQNAQRLKFYERHGARPIANTAYETPVTPGTPDPPYLVLDPLDAEALPGRDETRAVVRAILERKYGHLCPPGYIETVVASFRDDPIVLRPPRYTRRGGQAAAAAPAASLIPLVVNDRHLIHHVRERGYVESPVRIRSILGDLEATGLFRKVAPIHHGERHIRAVHDGALVDYLDRVCRGIAAEKSLYPYVFPIRNPARPPKDLAVCAGYYCIDTFTPLNSNAYKAARRAVDCALTAAQQVLEGARLAYALVRPPGHHAERRAFGGFCYFNNAASAAHYLSRYGRVAVLDIDYHHGNGTQDIFYERADVLTVSIHGHPSLAYPYFSGFREERGRGPGAGFNLNIPLPEEVSPDAFREALGTALRRIQRHRPDYLVLALGFDTAKSDPTGTWSNRAADFTAIGRRIGEAGFPTLVVQEGGYRVRTLGSNARHFFVGLHAGAAAARSRPRAQGWPVVQQAPFAWREEVGAADVEAVRALVAETGVFSTAETAIAAELLEERVHRGSASGYEFVLVEAAGRPIGYACYGPIPGTEWRFDLYWIAVAPAHRSSGLGREILARTEAAIAAAGGQRIYVETSSTDAYAPARRFYRAMGYRRIAELDGFYRPGDGKVIFVKEISR
jgi:acetoin utilization deacetylase AcuC-like enzyme/GNAT superfamily N-acetyltransferase